MQESLFPVGLVVDEEYLTFESMKAHEEGWEMESVQLGDGAFHSMIKAVHTPRVQLALQTYSTPMLLKGTYPEGSTLLYVIESETAPVIHKKPRAKNALIVGQEGAGVDVVINSSSAAYTLAIESTFLKRHFYEHYHLLFDDYVDQYELTIQPEKLKAFIEAINAWIAYLSTDALKPTFEHRYETIEKEILDFLFASIVFEEKALRQKKFDISKVKELLETRLMEPLDMIGVAAELNISERQLYNAFKKLYAITPKKFLQNLRLNAVKQELLDGETGHLLISDVAYKFGFTHMSHFTSEYKKLFGTTPSATLAKKRI